TMGRSYAYLPAGLGPTILEREKTVDRIILMGGESRSVDPGAVFAVASGVKPIAEDELAVGIEAAPELGGSRPFHATMWLQGSWLRRGLETTPTVFDNPGRHGGTPAIRDTGLFAVELATPPNASLVLRIGYMYGRTTGSWNGAFDPRQGAVLFAGSDF